MKQRILADIDGHPVDADYVLSEMHRRLSQRYAKEAQALRREMTADELAEETWVRR